MGGCALAEAEGSLSAPGVRRGGAAGGAPFGGGQAGASLCPKSGGRLSLQPVRQTRGSASTGPGGESPGKPGARGMEDTARKSEGPSHTAGRAALRCLPGQAHGRGGVE